ncbi:MULTISPECIES: SDR family NAD(P)-dependent oxidoreductase [Burkholderiales]|jgi:NAD(P)-dependent dehydrogenase (short-subunit alcohol dehydrogenase family)|uniref:SDR family NAD(P)-dependent oxidoreductase n=1 Tax=Burkholderiales TaxID=80840 RepID=UPI000CFFD7EF|nr:MULTISPECIES: SDR family NAD(P)-dependent oxidoreductase [Burkholderiales]MCR4143222.1 SDR family NAD(P)-dependent oxidoreductase [Alcaligenes faecalis]MCT9013829.1 SDR family NAD(P)-dependent oxidoreductase [Cupriavidus gilardii]MCT9052017.1 SDR family NAD(P)-dependent oxidoreductase [Cupriavidus gilardii]MCT9074519.1 SDR family NAD(P)-dependent oxidoreductase [Cupriavidus gilardii]PRH09209.1 3-hydroxyacyl-CoA dehydrogenase [Burkholderia multivorans]
MNVNNKVAVVTGAASGLGLATCKALAAAGARVVGFDLDAETVQAALAPDIRGLAVDVANEADIKTGIDTVLELHGAIHIVVNCAGILGPCKTLSKGQMFPTELWERVIAVNLSGTFNMIRHAALAMSRNEPDESGDRGVIVNTASGAAWQGQMGQAAYSASKAGVIGMTLPIARDLAEHGIRMVAIAPGLFDTGMAAGMPPKVADKLINNMVLYPARMGQPEEFAGLVRHVVENSYINATTISIDGGGRVGTR